MPLLQNFSTKLPANASLFSTLLQHFSTSPFSKTSLQHFCKTFFSNTSLHPSSPTLLYKLSSTKLSPAPLLYNTLLYNTLLQHFSTSVFSLLAGGTLGCKWSFARVWNILQKKTIAESLEQAQKKKPASSGTPCSEIACWNWCISSCQSDVYTCMHPKAKQRATKLPCFDSFSKVCQILAEPHQVLPLVSICLFKAKSGGNLAQSANPKHSCFTNTKPKF